MAIAKITQEAWVTSDFPILPGVTVHSRFLPYEQIGGDLILCEKASDGSLVVLFGDISGHGISAALVSGIVAVTFKKYAKGDFSPSEILRQIHLELSPWVHKHHISACLFRQFSFCSTCCFGSGQCFGSVFFCEVRKNIKVFDQPGNHIPAELWQHPG